MKSLQNILTLALLAVLMTALATPADAQIRKFHPYTFTLSDTTAVADTMIFEFPKLIDDAACYVWTVTPTIISDTIDATIQLQETLETSGDTGWFNEGTATTITNQLDGTAHRIKGDLTTAARQRLYIINTDGQIRWQVKVLYKQRGG